jgi:alpha-mannosidase
VSKKEAPKRRKKLWISTTLRSHINYLIQKIIASRKMKNIVHFISHTHWDPAWFAQRKYTRRWLVPFINKVLETLKAQPTYKFVLDGQTSILEDYFDQLSEKERIEKKAELVSRVKEGRLLVGPFYIGADWTLVSASALFHNLLYGCQDAKRLGGVMKVGWLTEGDLVSSLTWSWEIAVALR